MFLRNLDSFLNLYIVVAVPKRRETSYFTALTASIIPITGIKRKDDNMVGREADLAVYMLNRSSSKPYAAFLDTTVCTIRNSRYVFSNID